MIIKETFKIPGTLIIVKEGTELLITEESKLLKRWKARTFEEKIDSLMKYPYDSELYYHITEPDNVEDILRTGINGEEIWVTKEKPHEEYRTGTLFSLDLRGLELKKDPRWSGKHRVSIVLDQIPVNRIIEIFERLPEINQRTDLMSASIINSNISREKVETLVKQKGL